MYEETKKFLHRYYFLSLKIEALQKELECLETLADGTQGCSFDTERTSKSPSLKAPFIAYLDRLEKKRKQLNEKIQEALILKEEIETAIETVGDPLAELVLTFRYINCMDWREVADKLGYTESYVFELHRKGLQKVKLKEHSKS